MKTIKELGISPTPWYRKGYENGKQHFSGNIHSGKIRVCGCNFLCDEGDANANLISAAPELYESLRIATEYIQKHSRFITPELMEMLSGFKSALLKASGEKEDE